MHVHSIYLLCIYKYKNKIKYVVYILNLFIYDINYMNINIDM